MVIPFAPSAGWYACYFRAVALGLTADEAAARACVETEVMGKAFARSVITGPQGPERLSVPVDGGAGVLKRLGGALGASLPSPLLSDHGKWRREHLGAWNAAYGRTPYFQHLFPELESVYAASGRESLDGFNRRLHAIALRWLGSTACAVENRERLRGVIREYETKVNSSVSIFDALFRLGRNTIFALL